MAEPHNPVGEQLRSYGRERCDFYGLAERLKAKTDWHMGSMWAEHAYGPRHYGQLPVDKRQGLGWADYVVYSYDTPIAWHVSHGGESYWVQPDVNYSSTTTNHQGQVATAISVIDKV